MNKVIPLEQEKIEISEDLSKRVPRYTSYPTAPHFHKQINGAVYKNWLKTIDQSQTLSLYLHIPYCKQLCWFCGCHTKITPDYSPVKNYLQLIKKEMEMISHYLPNSPVTHVHFGGGSPTILEPADFDDTINVIKQHFNLSPSTEIAIEIDPRTVDKEKIESYARNGIKRASIGVQDFNFKVQEAVNRIQPYKLVNEVIQRLRSRHITALNVDLIYGLPYQTLETIRETIYQTLTLKPDRISLFGYAHVPWMKKYHHLLSEDVLPDSSLRFKMFSIASEILTSSGYIAIGLDHFARESDSLAQAFKKKLLKRNFQGYTTDVADNLIGIGTSSISSISKGYVQNIAGSLEYEKSILSAELPILRGIELTQEDKDRRTIIMSLMCQFKANVCPKIYQNEINRLAPYFKNKVASYKDGILVVNPEAKKDIRVIASVFDAYFPKANHQYSPSI